MHARELGTRPQWQVTVRRLIVQWILHKLGGLDWIHLVHGWNNSLSNGVAVSYSSSKSFHRVSEIRQLCC
jgi:hypothetical protein